jgi:hypothetical protein
MNDYFEEISEEDADKWAPKPKGFYPKLFLAILENKSKYTEIKIEKIKKDFPKTTIKSIITVFYSWKRKDSTKKLLNSRKIDMKIRKRGNRLGVVKVPK